MSKICRDCGGVNGDDRIFCQYCGEPLDAELQMYMDLQHVNGEPKKTRTEPVYRDNDDDDEIVKPVRREEKKSRAPWIILGLIAAAVVLWLVLK